MNHQALDKEVVMKDFERAMADLQVKFESYNQEMHEKMVGFVGNSSPELLAKVQGDRLMRGIVKDRDVIDKLFAELPKDVRIDRPVYNSSIEPFTEAAFNSKTSHLKEALVIVRTQSDDVYMTYLSLSETFKRQGYFILKVVDEAELKVDRDSMWTE